jgi:hypothetical protein
MAVVIDDIPGRLRVALKLVRPQILLAHHERSVKCP